MAWIRETPAGGWRASYRDPSGKTRSRSFGSNEKGKARKWAHDQEASIRGGTYRPPDSSKVTLLVLYDELHSEKPYASATLTLHTYLWGDLEDQGHPLYALRHRRAATISREDVDKALSQIPAPAVRDKTRLLLSTLFNYGMTEHSLAENPAKVLRRPTTRAEKLATTRTKDRKRYLDDGELARLAAAVPPRYEGLVTLMGRVGLRPGEALALVVGKFDPMRRRLVIDTSVSGFTKTGEARELTLPAITADGLVAHLATYSDPADPTAIMFPAQDGAMLSVNGWRHIFQRAVKRAGLPGGLTPNDLRHSAVSWSISLGADVYAVQRMVGHSKPSITLDVYGELWDGSQERLAERQDEALRELEGDTTTGAAILAITP